MPSEDQLRFFGWPDEEVEGFPVLRAESTILDAFNCRVREKNGDPDLTLTTC
jgi:hypothetical protein